MPIAVAPSSRRVYPASTPSRLAADSPSGFALPGSVCAALAISLATPIVACTRIESGNSATNLSGSGAAQHGGGGSPFSPSHPSAHGPAGQGQAGMLLPIAGGSAGGAVPAPSAGSSGIAGMMPNIAGMGAPPPSTPGSGGTMGAGVPGAAAGGPGTASAPTPVPVPPSPVPPPACPPGFADCDGLPGCEVDLNTSTLHCGSCGHSCIQLHNAACVSGRCTGFALVESEDTYVDSARPNLPHGTSKRLLIDFGPHFRKVFIRPKDLAGMVSPGSTLVGASLVLHAFKAGDPGFACEVLEHWEPQSATWTTAPTTKLRQCVDFPVRVGEVSVDLTDAARRWLSQPGPVHGVALRTLGEQETGFHSSRVADPALRPVFRLQLGP